MGYTILAADDETELLDVLELYLGRENIGIRKAKDGIEAMEIFHREEVHLALLDIMMPGLDGFSVLRKIRETSRIPAIMLTAKSEDYDKILGLELGADDYITKPYNPLEVVARIKAQLRRNYDYREESARETQFLQVKGLVLRPEEGLVTLDEEVMELTSTEFKILRLLMEYPGRIFTRQQIFEQVWEEEYARDDNTVMVHISNLRGKLERMPGEAPQIRTVKGLGYKLEKEA
ncbi:response regulator transcription factor [Faecalicatena sp. AGMB00832]|uniref:Response regulator transcription factor n=1 Tax=Faecalicatena faecalis TaxID=2726362 RepID=A0ABS6D4E9_9FIRM|nr:MULTISPECIES: response regulator transcription factor [Faecalicatena]MBU3876087.1 response regulator transcription factor [Faecalicatena faecalis]MCI6464006.1 response regulator transcription factor [Faecalicatena sp.]MDY5618974.1 response regulator transcription factor [Lachnospiraceae bacterium]